MKPLALLVALIVLAVAQVTVAPLFPVASAQADLLLVALALLTVFAGRHAAMVSVPLMAIFLGFASDRSIGILILAFLPFPLLAFWLAEGGPPMTRFMQTLLAVVATGTWARTLLAMSAVAGGASLEVGALLVQYVIPGAFIDGLLLALCYLPLRLLRLEPRGLSPVRQRYRV
jgi:hypothetical protein